MVLPLQILTIHTSTSSLADALGQRVATQFGEGTIQSYTVLEGSSASYRVKLPFGTAYLSPAAVLYAIPSKDSPYVRRDGKMVRDMSLKENGGSLAYSAHKLDEKYEILFGTENIYVFLRLYVLLCTLLDDICEHCDTFGCSGDPSRDYCRRTSRQDNLPADPLTYSSMLRGLRQVLSHEATLKEFEAFGRTIAKEKAYLIASLPSLVQRCGEALLAVAQEDCLLHLYDYCQYRQVDPVAVRTHCFSMSPQAVFRIQYDTSSGAMYWNYLPRSVELVTTPPLTMATASVASGSAIGSASSSGGDGAAPMDEGSDDADPIEDSSEEDGVVAAAAAASGGGGSGRPAKRAKT